ncbi:MAG: hypothetical protein ABI693_07130 [Bryobacteraceae bacterium]
MKLAVDWVPMEWPAAWDTAKLELLRGTAVNCLLHGPAGFEAPAMEQVTLIPDCPWPGLPPRDGSSAGPTGNPWIDANGWQVRLAKAHDAQKPVWLASGKVESANYAMAAADAAMCGGRWVVKLDDQVAAGVAAGHADAVKAWKDLTLALGFFEKHREWAAMEPVAKLAIVSDFKEMNPGELLNLAARQHVGYRIVLKDSHAISFAGMEAVLYADDQPPAKPLLAAMEAFAREGGLLMAPRPTAELVSAVGPVIDTQIRTVVHRLGKGRLAVPLKEWDDPFLLASDAHLLMSYRHDPVRLFNAGLLIPYVTSGAGRTVVQLVNYVGNESANFVSMAVQTVCRAARWCTLETPEPRPLELHREAGRIELRLPPFRTYAAIEIEG